MKILLPAAGMPMPPRSGPALEVVVAHGRAHLDAVFGEVHVAAPLLDLPVLGVISSGGEVLERVELDDGDVLSVLRGEVLVGDETRHRAGKFVHARAVCHEPLVGSTTDT